MTEQILANVLSYGLRKSVSWLLQNLCGDKAESFDPGPPDKVQFVPCGIKFDLTGFLVLLTTIAVFSLRFGCLDNGIKEAGRRFREWTIVVKRLKSYLDSLKRIWSEIIITKAMFKGIIEYNKASRDQRMAMLIQKADRHWFSGKALSNTARPQTYQTRFGSESQLVEETEKTIKFQKSPKLVSLREASLVKEDTIFYGHLKNTTEEKRHELFWRHLEVLDMRPAAPGEFVNEQAVDGERFIDSVNIVYPEQQQELKEAIYDFLKAESRVDVWTDASRKIDEDNSICAGLGIVLKGKEPQHGGNVTRMERYIAVATPGYSVFTLETLAICLVLEQMERLLDVLNKCPEVVIYSDSKTAKLWITSFKEKEVYCSTPEQLEFKRKFESSIRRCGDCVTWVERRFNAEADYLSKKAGSLSRELHRLDSASPAPIMTQDSQMSIEPSTSTVATWTKDRANEFAVKRLTEEVDSLKRNDQKLQELAGLVDQLKAKLETLAETLKDVATSVMGMPMFKKMTASDQSAEQLFRNLSETENVGAAPRKGPTKRGARKTKNVKKDENK